MREVEFVNRLRELVSQRVTGIDEGRKREIVRRLTRGIGAATPEPEVRVVPFVTGRRPVDEARYPGLGSSDHAALLLNDAGNTVYVLFHVLNAGSLPERERRRLELRANLSFAGPWGDESTAPLPAWRERKVTPRVLVPEPDGGVALRDVALDGAGERSLVLAFDPMAELLPEGSGLDPAIRDTATDAADAFTFGHLFLQRLRVELLLLRDGAPISAAEAFLDVCDARRFGSLYQRVVERIVRPDAARQGREAGVAALGPESHPWFPVLLIGSDKAALFMRALVEDIVHKKRHLTDPRWLLRVGLYLEFLTCLGIFEAVRDDLGDVLTPAERAAFETSPWFAAIRKHVNVAAWRKVWALRKIAFPQLGAPRAGDVSMTNLLAKKKATLAFLEAHHEDLRHAIEMAGPNAYNAQETWHRVFRDAERAVLRKTAGAFPELASLPPKALEFVLWHRQGHVAGVSVPRGLAGWFGDQDGLYASACNQYRASMNHVADWARRRGLMDHAGDECVPESVSLLRAAMDGRTAHLAQLQRRDGYAGTLEVVADAPRSLEPHADDVVRLLRAVPVFTPLTDDEVRVLATAARPIELGPVERIVVQGGAGSSLFVVAEGRLEVLRRENGGADVMLATLEPGAVFGEMSLLTGEPRSATVRSLEAAVVYEIGQAHLAPLLKARPSAVDEIAALVAQRQRANTAAGRSGAGARTLGKRIRSFFG